MIRSPTKQAGPGRCCVGHFGRGVGAARPRLRPNTSRSPAAAGSQPYACQSVSIRTTSSGIRGRSLRWAGGGGPEQVKGASRNEKLRRSQGDERVQRPRFSAFSRPGHPGWLRVRCYACLHGLPRFQAAPRVLRAGRPPFFAGIPGPGAGAVLASCISAARLLFGSMVGFAVHHSPVPAGGFSGGA